MYGILWKRLGWLAPAVVLLVLSVAAPFAAAGPEPRAAPLRAELLRYEAGFTLGHALSLDGVPLITKVTGGTIVATPSQYLTDGQHRVAWTVVDNAGNTTSDGATIPTLPSPAGSTLPIALLLRSRTSTARSVRFTPSSIYSVGGRPKRFNLRNTGF